MRIANSGNAVAIVFALLSVRGPSVSAASWPAGVDPTGRHLVDREGKPFFWLGDTAWLLFQMPGREDAEHYLLTRAKQGFTVIQAALVMGEERVGGTTRPNAHGDTAFVDGDPGRPRLTPGNDPRDAKAYDYWDHADHVIERAAAHGLCLGLLPLFVGHGGDGYHHLQLSNAEAYGRFLGERYGSRPNIIWLLGGDNVPDSDEKKAIWHTMAKGITEAVAGSEDYSKTLMTYHSPGGAGDTVLVREGVYRGQVFLRFSGEPDRPIVFKNAPGERPVVDGEGRGRIELQAEAGWRHPIGWVTVEGFEVRNGWDGIKFYNAHHIVLRGNSIHDNANQGILGNGHHVLIEGNTIAGNGLGPDKAASNKEHGIYCTGADITIQNNVIHSNRAYGIQVAGYPFDRERHAGPEFAGARRWRIAHNTIAFQENRAAIVLWQGEAADGVIEGNIFYRNAAKRGTGDCQGVDFAGPGGGHRIRNNLAFAPGRVPLGASSGDHAIVTELREEDPLFVDPERFDFHLRQGSPAIDAAPSQEVVATDRDGTSRPRGKASDLGAYEARALDR